MSANLIGTAQFDLIENDPWLPGPQEQAEASTRPGIDYQTLVGQGKRGIETTWTGCTKFCADSDAAATFLAVLDAMAGTIVTAYNAWSQEFEDVFVVDVGAEAPRRVIENGNDRVMVRRAVKLLKVR